MIDAIQEQEFKAKVLSQSIFVSNMQIQSAKTKLAELQQKQALLESEMPVNTQKIVRNKYVIKGAARTLLELERQLEVQQERLATNLKQLKMSEDIAIAGKKNVK